jgi:DNA adenine methylase
MTDDIFSNGDVAFIKERDHYNRSHPFIKPAFGYYGSKLRLSARIAPLLPPHEAWLEAFCGSAAVTLNKAPAPIEIINDLDDQIINLFCVLREQPHELCRVLALTPYARREFESARTKALSDNPLEKARRFLVASMMTVNGTSGSALTNNSGFSFSNSYARDGREARVNRWYQLPARLQPIVERLRSVRVEHKDALELITQHHKRPASLIYLDPPYLMDRRHQYTKDANDKAFHEKLLKLCTRSHCMMLISGYANELYEDYLTKANGWKEIRLETGTRGVAGKDLDRTEVLWVNEVFREAKKANRVLLAQTAREKRIGKNNPTRALSPLKRAAKRKPIRPGRGASRKK